MIVLILSHLLIQIVVRYYYFLFCKKMKCVSNTVTTRVCRVWFIKAEDKLTLSHMQLETIMYQSLDAAISTRNQYIKTNRLALLSAII